MSHAWSSLLSAGLVAASLLAATPLQGRADPASATLECDGQSCKVTKPGDSYFDVAARTALLRHTDDPLLAQLRDKLAMAPSCRQMKSRPVLNDELTLPSFHENPETWKLAVEPLAAFEQAMSDLAGAWVASGDRYYADCLIALLDTWAREDALADFQFSPARPQAWYALESMIFSAALAYSTVTAGADIAPEQRRVIEGWLVRIAKRHFERHASMRSCCDDHFYRRSLYMTIVGVVTGADEMFQTGLEAVHVALGDLNERGAFKFAVKRGWRAIHYQNHILLHLVMIMQIAYRQGYDLFDLTVDGRGFGDAVAFLMRSMEHPHNVEGLPPGEQDLSFTDDGRYFSWMEIWLSHFENPAMTKFVRHYRPIAGRSAGGHMTLYFKAPEDPRVSMLRDLDNSEVLRKVEGEFSERYPLLKRLKRSQ